MGSLLNWLEAAVQRVRAFAYKQPRDRQSRRPRVGLALGGGFARGIAHIGVLKVLEQNNIPIDFICGTSVGALLAAAYACGTPLEQMERQASATRFKDFARWTISWLGLASNHRLESLLHRLSSSTRFEETRIPLAIAATDLVTGEPVYFTQGELGPALRASCAYPGLFLPVEHQGRILVDGFLVAAVPVDAVRRMGADFVIAVYLEAAPPDHKPKNMADIIGRSFAILQRHAQQDWRERADLVIEPNVKHFLWDDFEKTRELITAGEAAARAALPKIQAALATSIPQTASRVLAYR